MSHNLEIIDGQASFFSVKEKAWHGLGKVLPENLNLEQAIIQANLNWEVEPLPMFLANGKEIPNKVANVRKDNGNIVGVVGDKYRIVQNLEAFSFFDFLEGEACFETGGVLNKGNIVWLSCKLPAHFSVAGSDDLIEQYLFLTTSHDGSKSLQCMFTPVRVVCNNTLNIALRSFSNRLKIRHTTNVQDKIKQAHKVMGIVNQFNNEVNNVFQKLARVKVTDAQVLKLIQMAMVPNKEVGDFEDLPTTSKNRIGDILSYYDNHDTQQNIKGTAWGVYNAITGFNQNNDKSTNERKMKSIINGNNTEQRVFDLCLQLA
jgi:phage/plasmid-like protein (TIGR03299 family)